MSTYTRTEVIQHNTKADCWIIVCNNVYDITAFVAKHPGGMDVLLSRAGEDATSYFITKHGKSKAVIKQLERFKIGELQDAERVTANDFEEPFLMELINRCIELNLYKKSVWYKNAFFWTRAVMLFLFFVLSLITLYTPIPKPIAVLFIIIQSFLGTSLFGLLAHEDTHQKVTNNLFLHYGLKLIWPVIWPFISQNPLRYEHNSHHIKIGDPEYDFEVAGFAQFIRYSTLVPFKSIHRQQHRLAAILYPFYANIITTVGGIKSQYWKNHNRQVALEHNLSIVLSLVYFIVLPTLVNGFSIWLVVLYLVYQCVLFYGIYIGSAINHFIPNATIPIPDEHKNKYAYYICQNTSNFCLDNPFWFWYTGGFNVQIEHHLIPFIPAENLRKMIPIVQALCVKYNYPYRHYSTFNALWKEHYAYLAEMATNTMPAENAEAMNKRGYQAR